MGGQEIVTRRRVGGPAGRRELNTTGRLQRLLALYNLNIFQRFLLQVAITPDPGARHTKVPFTKFWHPANTCNPLIGFPLASLPWQEQGVASSKKEVQARARACSESFKMFELELELAQNFKTFELELEFVRKF